MAMFFLRILNASWATLIKIVAIKLKYNREEIIKLTGKIYCISNNINDKLYIGKTTYPTIE
jgi:hypothetical protein